MPKVPQRLPRAVLSASDVERILAGPDLEDAIGLRDRAVLETLSSTAVRRRELCRLAVYDLDVERGTLLIREGKWKKALGRKAGCHIFRHTMATHMLEGGADIRFIQEMLGHSNLLSTQIYTRVALAKLKAIHSATHPGARLVRKPHVEAEGKPATSCTAPLCPEDEEAKEDLDDVRADG